jgi:hypothetical protein
MKTNVYLTVDTENSMGGAWNDSRLRPVPADRRIFCQINGESYGIGWMCRELNARKLKATFFCEVFGSLVFGEDETRRWFQYLLDQQQDVQMHTHLNYYYYSRRSSAPDEMARRTDNLADLEPPLRGELVDRACDFFRRAAGYDATAYRAGNWRCSRALLQDLGKRGIVVDASFNRTLQNSGSFKNESIAVNTLQCIDGVWELPITVARQSLPDPALADGVRPFDVVSMSRWEMKKVLEDAHASRSTHVSAVLHSFSGVKAKDLQYQHLRPDQIVRRRFTALLDYLAANQDRFRVSTVGELALEARSASSSQAGWIPSLGFFHPLARKLVQAVNSLY